MIQQPSRWLALLGSLISPGLGHLYAGFPRRALLWALAGLVLGPTAVFLGLAALSELPALFMLAAAPLAILPPLTCARWPRIGLTFH